MVNKGDAHDPKGLIYEAYRIEGITSAECRSIFLDWALSLSVEKDTETALKALIDGYAVSAPNHPMTAVLTEGLKSAKPARRRGGWRARARGDGTV